MLQQKVLYFVKSAFVLHNVYAQKNPLPGGLLDRPGRGFTLSGDRVYLMSFSSHPKALAPKTAASESFNSDINSLVLPL